MSFGQFFNILWMRRGIILLSTLLCFLGALLVVKLLPPSYQATTRVVLDIIKPDPVTGEVMSSSWARSYANTQQELITDYRVAGKAVDALGWTSSPAYSALYARRDRDETSDFRRWLAQLLIKNAQAKLIDSTNILEISYTTSSADEARKTANAIRQAYYEQTLAFRREGSARNAEWFHQQAEKLREQLATAEKKKADFEKANGIILQDDNTDAESDRLKALSSAAPPAAAMAAAPPPSPIAAQLAQLDAQIVSATRTLGPNHPDIQAMRNQRVALASAAAQEAAANRAARSGASGPSIDSMVSNQTNKVLAQRGKVYEAKRLATDVSVLRDQFNKTLARAAELDRDSQSTETGLTLLGEAVAPEDPIFPKVGLVVGGAVAFGLIFGLMLSLMFELLYRRVRCAADLELIGVPIMGTMAIDPSKVSKRGLMYWLGLKEIFARSTPSATS